MHEVGPMRAVQTTASKQSTIGTIGARASTLRPSSASREPFLFR
jgi:hypothetical protein